MESSRTKVSIISVAYNQPKVLENSLTSLIENTDYDNFEIIISHNKTTPPIDREIMKVHDSLTSLYNKRILYTYSNKNLKFGPGIMKGFPLSDGKIICVLNDDTFFSKKNSDWLTKLVTFMETDSNIATLTPSMYHKNNTVYWIGKRNPNKKFHDFLHVKMGDHRLPTEPYEVCYNNMACCLIQRELIAEFGIGKNYPHYGSDSEFCNRVKGKYPEMKHVVFPEAKIFHFNLFSRREI